MQELPQDEGAVSLRDSLVGASQYMILHVILDFEEFPLAVGNAVI